LSVLSGQSVPLFFFEVGEDEKRWILSTKVSKKIFGYD